MSRLFEFPLYCLLTFRKDRYNGPVLAWFETLVVWNVLGRLRKCMASQSSGFDIGNITRLRRVPWLSSIVSDKRAEVSQLLVWYSKLKQADIQITYSFKNLQNFWIQSDISGTSVSWCTGSLLLRVPVFTDRIGLPGVYPLYSASSDIGFSCRVPGKSRSLHISVSSLCVGDRLMVCLLVFVSWIESVKMAVGRDSAFLLALSDRRFNSPPSQ